MLSFPSKMPSSPAFRTRSYSWPYQNFTNADSEAPHIVVKIQPSMHCVPIPLRMALTWTILTKTLNRLFIALQSNGKQLFEYWPPSLSEVGFKVFREDTFEQITSEKWARTLHPDMVIVVEFGAPELPPTFLAPGLEQRPSHSGRRRPHNLHLSLLPSPKGLEKHPASGGLSGTGSPCLMSPTLPSIKELSCSPAQSVFFAPARRFCSTSTRAPSTEPIAIEQEGNNVQWNSSDTPCGHLMDVDDEMTYPPSSVSPSPWTRGHDRCDFKLNLPPPKVFGQGPDVASKADGYEEDEEDGSSDDSNLWGDVSGGDEAQDHGMEGVESSQDCAEFVMATGALRPTQMRRRQTYPQPHQPLRMPSPEADNSHSLAFSRVANVRRWDGDRTSRQELAIPAQDPSPMHIGSRSIARSSPARKRKRGVYDEENQVDIAFEGGIGVGLGFDSSMHTELRAGRGIKRIRPVESCLGVY